MSKVIFNFKIEKIIEDDKERYKVYTDNSNTMVEYSGRDLLTIIASLTQFANYYAEMSVKLIDAHSKGLDTTLKDEVQEW